MYADQMFPPAYPQTADTPQKERTQEMPIIGVTDRQSIIAGFPQVGTLHKGDKKSPNAPGKERPHFRFESGIPGLKDLFTETYGPTPRALRVLLPCPAMEGNISTGIELWTGSRLIWRANGKRTIRRWMPELKRHSDRETDQIDMPDNPDAKWIFRLNVRLPEFIEAGYPGTVLLAATSKNDCINLSANILEMERRAGMEGKDLTQVLFILYRAQKSIAVPDQKKRFNHWLCYLRPAQDWVRQMIAQARNPAYQMIAAPKQQAPAPPGPAARTIDVETGEITDPFPSETVLPEGPGVDDELEPDDGADLVNAPMIVPPANYSELYERVISGELSHFYKGGSKSDTYGTRKHVANYLKQKFGKPVPVPDAWKALVEHDAEQRQAAEDLEDKPPPLTEDEPPDPPMAIADIKSDRWADDWIEIAKDDPTFICEPDGTIKWVRLAQAAHELGFPKVTEGNVQLAIGAVCDFFNIAPF